jgi:multidrug resistance protein, MATE family
MEDQALAPLLQPLPLGETGAIKGRARRAALEWWVESKKLWHIVGPAIFQRIALYGVNVVTQSFIGHLGDLELAAFSIAATVVGGFNFGFLVILPLLPFAYPMLTHFCLWSCGGT